MTEIGSPSIVPAPADPLPLITGDQEEIETLDSIPVSDGEFDAANRVPTPSPSPSSAWSEPSGTDRASGAEPGTRSRRAPVLIGVIAAAVVVLAGLALLMLFVLDVGPGEDALPEDPRRGSEGTSTGPDRAHSGKTVTIWLEVSPLAATITWDGRVVDESPLVVPHGPRETELLISHPGHMPERLMIIPDRERSVRVNLHRLP